MDSTWPSASTTTNTMSSTVLGVQKDEDGSWIITDLLTTVYGHGDTFLEAQIDYYSALRSTLRIIEDNPSSDRLLAEAKSIRWLLGLDES